MGSAEQYVPICNKLAIVTGCTVLNCNYRLAPEAKMPLPVFDAYAILKDVIERAGSLGIDPSRVMMAGESGGALISMALGYELGLRKESHLVKCMLLMVPMVGDFFVSEGALPESECTEAEQGLSFHNQRAIYNFLSADYKRQKSKDPYIYPSCMLDEAMAKIPPCIVFGGEFDQYRRDTCRLAKRLATNGKLLDFVLHPGQPHGQYMFKMDVGSS
jgi:acetyl esterase